MKVGFACGVFDLFHAGHVLMLKECKEHCNYLIVALNKAENIDYNINPGKSAPVYSFDERKLILESCRFVDEVIGYNSEEDLMTILKSKKIDVRFLGDDYRGKAITGPDLVKEIYYTNRSHGLSTSNYRRKIFEQKNK
jgi:glycerol-3-phosphate cytidylyltransferase